MRFYSVNIFDEIDDYGEEKVREKLSTFYCPINPKIEDFFRNKSIDFSRRKLSVTYIVNDLDDDQMVGCFALTHKALLFSHEKISISKNLADVMQKKRSRNIFNI